MLCLPLSAQEEQEQVASSQDSLIRELQQQLQEMKLQRILMAEALDRADRSAQLDSMAQVRRRQRVDSLRLITQGAPLVIDGDTLLILYAQKGGMLPENRAEAAKEKIESIGRQLTLRLDSVHVFDSDFFTDIMAGEEVILTITDTDGLWLDKSRQQLAEEYAAIIQGKIEEIHQEYGLRKKLWGLAFAIIIIVVQYILIRLTNRLFRYWRRKLIRWAMGVLKPIIIKDY